MSGDKKEETRDRTRMLVELRREFADEVKRAQAIMKEQQVARKKIEKAMAGGPRSVPQLASDTGLAAHEVLWHVASMKKYGVVTEAGTDESGDYFLYALPGEKKL
jgi:predicted transcriptional regulator